MSVHWLSTTGKMHSNKKLVNDIQSKMFSFLVILKIGNTVLLKGSGNYCISCRLFFALGTTIFSPKFFILFYSCRIVNPNVSG